CGPGVGWSGNQRWSRSVSCRRRVEPRRERVLTGGVEHYEGGYVMLSSLRWRMRSLLTAGVAAGLLAMSAAGTVSAAPMQASDHTARTWYVQTGAQSPNEVIQGMVFLPGTITIDVGDTVVWQAHSAEPHTVTFNAAPNARFNPFAPAVGNGATFD